MSHRRSLVIAAAAALSLAVGCADQKVEPDHPTDGELSGMSREQMMLAGQNKIADGQTTVSHAKMMNADQEYDGMTRGQVMDGGERAMDRGRAIVDRAVRMPPPAAAE